MAEYPKPLSQLRFAPNEIVLGELQEIRQTQVQTAINGRFNKLLYYLMLTKYENIEETSWVSKEEAIPLAFDLVREVKVNKPQGKASIPLSPRLQIDIYRKLFNLGIFNTAEQDALKSIWHEAIETINEPFLHASEEQRFATLFLPEKEQRKILQTNSEGLLSFLSGSKDLSFLDGTMMNALFDLQSSAGRLLESEIAARLQNFFLSLHVGNTFDSLKGYIFAMTFPAIAKSHLSAQEKNIFIDSAIEKARNNIAKQLDSAVLQASKKLIKLEAFPTDPVEILKWHRFISDLRHSIFNSTFENVVGIHLAKAIDHDKSDSLVNACNKYDELAEGACGYYLQIGNEDKALYIWRTIGNNHNSHAAFIKLQEYFLRHGMSETLDKIEDEFLLRWSKDRFQTKDVLYDMKYGRFTYLCERLGESDEISDFLDENSIKMAEEFIYAAIKLPKSHPLYQNADKILAKIINNTGQKENLNPDITDYARILRLILYWKTH